MLLFYDDCCVNSKRADLMGGIAMTKGRKGKKVVWTRLFVCVFFIYALFVIANQQYSIHKLNKVKAEVQKNVDASKMENERLKNLLKNAKDEKNLERMAREQLGLIKPGETVYVDQSSSDVYLHEGGN